MPSLKLVRAFVLLVEIQLPNHIRIMVNSQSSIVNSQLSKSSLSPPSEEAPFSPKKPPARSEPKNFFIWKTMQRYNTAIAGFECLDNYFSKKWFFSQGTKHAVILVIWSFGQNRFLVVKIRHYNYKSLFIIIVSKWPNPKMKMTILTLTTLTTINWGETNMYPTCLYRLNVWL